MSMIGNLARIPDETRVKLQQSPALITALLYPEMHQSAPKKAGFLDQFFGKSPSSAASKAPSASALAPLSPEDAMDLDKAWHGLHFIFTGSDWEGDFPQGFLVTNGEPVGDVDVGYGPARSFDAAEVAAISKFLESQNEAALKQRLDSEKMQELDIYPFANAEEIDVNEEWEYLAENYRRMKSFVQEAAAKRLCLLVYLN